MTETPRPYEYVGPTDLLGPALRSAPGFAVGSTEDLDLWARRWSRAELRESFTFVMDTAGVLRLAPRRSEHVACAGGASVLAAGEVSFVRGPGGWQVVQISNLSTGYCPDPDCWPVVAAALDRAGIEHPGAFTDALVFRGCPRCRQHNVVKDDDFTCAACGSELPRLWNICHPRHRAGVPAELVIDLPLPPDDSADQLARSLAPVDNSGFLKAVSAADILVHHRSVDTIVSSPDPGRSVALPEPTWSLLLRAVHLSFSAHLPLSLSPDVLWYAVVHEVAVHVGLNPDRYAEVFTDTPAHRQTITVTDHSLLGPDPDWSRSIRQVQEPLRERLGAEVTDLFLPHFSTTTPDDISSALVALMSTVSPYYRFEWITLCGIPRIRLEGRADDWLLLAQQVRALESWFEDLAPWFTALHPVLNTIAATAVAATTGDPVDTDFWNSLYKWQSLSGGDYISGWITAFFAHTQTVSGPVPKQSFQWQGGVRFKENAFPSHVSTVPFHWDGPDESREMQFMAGILGIDRDHGYLRPRLGHAVAEVLPTGPHPDDALLPDGWTHTRLRHTTGCPTAQALPTERAIRWAGDKEPGKDISASHVIKIAGKCLVRAATDGLWYAGDLLPDTGDIACWEELGHDFPTALRTL